MKQAPKTQNKLLKVKYINKSDCKNKIVSWNELTYEQLSIKIFNIFGLNHQKYYKLYYLDEQKQQITIDNQNDFDVFTEIMQYLILYLEQTSQGHAHFCKNVKENKIGSPQHFQQFKKTINEQKDKDILEQEKQFLIKIQKMKLEFQQSSKNLQTKFRRQLENTKININTIKDNEIQNLKQKIVLFQRQSKFSNKDQSVSITEQIQNRKIEVLAQLKNYKKQLEQKTIKHTEQRLKQIFNQLQDKRKSNQLHSVTCSSPSCAQSKSIQGIRYYCMICQMNLCQQCEISGQHENTNHPLLKIRDRAQTEELQKIMKLLPPSRNQQKNKQHQIQRKVRYLQTQLSISRQKALKFVTEHPNLQQSELVQQFLEKLI